MATQYVVSIDGKKVRLTKTQLTSDGDCHKHSFKLVELKTGMRPGKLIPVSSTCMYRGDDLNEFYQVSFRKRSIGCFVFDKKNWATIVDAAKKVQG